MHAPTALLRNARPTYSLRAVIMAGATVVVALLAGILSALTYQRLADTTLESAIHWSDSVARLASSSNTTPLILNDIATMESNLLEIARLPGIDNVAVFRADGRILVQASRHDGELHSTVGGDDRMAFPGNTETASGSLHNEYYESWAAIQPGTQAPQGWIRVHFDLAQRNQELESLWYRSLGSIALAVVLMMVGLHLILGRALRPIRNLSAFADRMPAQIGSQIALKEGCREVNMLGFALNHASRGIAEQVGRTRAIVNTASEAIIGLNGDGLVTDANPAASSFFGRPEYLLLNHPIADCVPGLDVTALQSMFGDRTENFSGMNRVLRKDFFGTRADGTLFPVEISLGQVQDVEGLRFVCIVRDVTDERAALEFTELYERALACSHNAVFITNSKLAHQPVVYVNDAFQAMAGLPLHKILGLGVDSLLSDSADGPALDELRHALAQQRNASVTLHKDLPDGTRRVLELSISPVRSDDGTLTHFVGIASDVSARVRAEEAIAERRAQLDAIFSLSPDGFVLFDAQDRMVFANPAFERMTGLAWTDCSEAISLNDFETVITEVCDPAQPFPSIQKSTQEGANWQARLQMIRPQMRVVQAQSRRNIAGRSETIFYFRDVTHEDAVDRMKSEFLAAAAHELRTPMVSIFGFTELLLRRKYTPERQADMLETIHRQSGLLVKMINELLDLARIESRGGLDLKIEESPLKTLIHNSVKGLMRPETERQVQIGDLPDVTVLIDPEKMQLAMNNLLSNAFKYSPQGGEVSVSATLDQRASDNYAVIEVRDHGMGMSPEQLARAFERFYRADASGNIPGTGLGLSMVKEVAELHHGQIELDSTFGKGTTARLWIPLAKALATTSTRPGALTY